MKVLGWIIIALALAIVVFILYTCLIMASKYDDIVEEYWNENEDQEEGEGNG